MPVPRKRKIETPEPDDFRIVGIASNEKPFSVCWELNRLLNAGLELGEPVIKQRIELNDKPSFMTFRASDENRNKLLLIENVNANGFFADKLQMFHYILITEGEKSAEIAKNIITKLKSSPMIMLCAEVSLKTKQEITFIKSYLV